MRRAVSRVAASVVGATADATGACVAGAVAAWTTGTGAGGWVAQPVITSSMRVREVAVA